MEKGRRQLVVHLSGRMKEVAEQSRRAGALPGGKLTDVQARAALAYAARLVGQGVPQHVAVEEGERLARANMLTVDGYKKKRAARA